MDATDVVRWYLAAEDCGVDDPIATHDAPEDLASALRAEVEGVLVVPGNVDWLSLVLELRAAARPSKP